MGPNPDGVPLRAFSSRAVACTSPDASSPAADTDARVTRAQYHRELAWAAQVLALMQREDGVLGD
ncbi:hypothetical protein I3F55_21995 [Streptomyces sp. MUM 16J]|nr:hypothetical protein [Streptomyces sp. MUM 16J]